MRKTTTEPSLRTKLQELLTIVIQGPKAGLDDHLSALKQLDGFLKSERSAGISGELRHFLSNRSYVKALNFVDSWDMSS